MAKKKMAVKPKKKIPGLSAKTGPIGGDIGSAMTGPIGPSLIGANIGKAQQLDMLEEINAQDSDALRMAAKKRLSEQKKMGMPMGAKAQSSGKAEVMPPGTFKNADGELVVGDMDAFQGKKRKAKVQKKK